MKSKDNEYRYKMAEQYYAAKKYRLAQQLYEDLFAYKKGTPDFENMYYKYAYCAYYLEDYANAENLFKTYIESFPNSPKTEECEYMRAYCYYKQSPKIELDQTNTTKTIGQMQAFINTHPNSLRVKDATEIIDKSRAKLEGKEYKSAELYYNLGYYKAAAIAYATLMEDFPDSEKGDEYKLKVIQAYYKYAEMSIEEKQSERYGKVISEITDFKERFPQSKYADEVERFRSLSNNYLNKNKNEQVKKAA
ncbi:MAG: outer rane assembly lipoprotein YfiO [Chitinophagaceae bacterium]|nr:outer rane assembly lipoprotein YfiO [Chitinophagaceae bacterium]